MFPRAEGMDNCIKLVSNPPGVVRRHIGTLWLLILMACKIPRPLHYSIATFHMHNKLSGFSEFTQYNTMLVPLNSQCKVL
jgi:hypothetical protein